MNLQSDIDILDNRLVSRLFHLSTGSSHYLLPPSSFLIRGDPEEGNFGIGGISIQLRGIRIEEEESPTYLVDS